MVITLIMNMKVDFSKIGQSGGCCRSFLIETSNQTVKVFSGTPGSFYQDPLKT